MRELAGLKVCFLAGTLGQGGAERQLYYMLRALKEHKAEPRVLSLTQGEYWEGRIRALGVPVTWVGQSGSRLQRLRAIIKELQREPPEVLQSQHFYTNIYVAAASRFLGLREIGALRSDAINEVGANKGPLGWMSLRAPRAVAANSRQAIENAVALGMARSRLHYLPNVVDTSQFASRPKRSDGTVRVLTIGRMVQQKRFDRFLRVLGIVHQQSANSVCGVLVGDGPLRARLERDATALGLLPEGLELHGLQPDVADFYHNADLFVLTSDWEGTPNVVLEAMASGLPVIATRVGGSPALISHGETGYLIDANDETAFADAVLELVQDAEKRTAFGNRARAFVEQHRALPELARELRRLYDAVLSPEQAAVPATAADAETPGRVKRLLVVTSVVHYRRGRQLSAYGPYALEIQNWARIFPQLVIASPCRNEAPREDCLPLPEGVTLLAQPETGGNTLRAKLAQIIMLPYSVLRLSIAIWGADAVHIRCPGNLGLLGALISPLLVRKRVAKFAGQWSDFDGEPWTVRLQRRLLRSRWWNAPVLVYSEQRNEPSHVVPFFTSGLSAAQVARARKAAMARNGEPLQRVLYAGRLSQSKNVHVLLHAIASVIRQGVSLKCTIVGEGPARDSLERQAAALGISSCVHFAGGVRPDEVLAYYESADVLVLASETEGWPKTLTEGMAFGLVCIGSNRGLTASMLAEGRGFLVPPGDATALADALRDTTALSIENRQQMRESALAWAERFTTEQFGESLRSLLDSHWGAPARVHRHVLRRVRYVARPRPVAVMHLTDTLEIGGAERMAVSLANSLARDRFEPHLCTTRRSGPLSDMIAPHVKHFLLDRHWTFDIGALRQLVRYIRNHEIQILHAHGTAVFISAAASLFWPYPAVVWHVHYGRLATDRKAGWQYRAIKRRVTRTLAVSEALAEWAGKTLGIRAGSVMYVPNFSSASESGATPLELPGTAGERLVCVANFLPEKDHLTLLQAMQRIVQVRPTAHLFLVGGGDGTQFGRAIRESIQRKKLGQNVSLLGHRRDVPDILRAVDIGVLSSSAEGLPLALIEYGEAGLPVVVTSVGQCADVVDNGRAGIVVEAGNPVQFADAVLRLIGSPAERIARGNALRKRVKAQFSVEGSIERIYKTYQEVLASEDRVQYAK